MFNINHGRGRPWAGHMVPPITLCGLHASDEECKAACWYPCEEPDRPLDLHGLFNTDQCDGCADAWARLGLPRGNLPILA